MLCLGRRSAPLSTQSRSMVIGAAQLRWTSPFFLRMLDTRASAQRHTSVSSLPVVKLWHVTFRLYGATHCGYVVYCTAVGTFTCEISDSPRRSSCPRKSRGAAASRQLFRATISIHPHPGSVVSGALATFASVLGKVAFDGDTPFQVVATASCAEHFPELALCRTVRVRHWT